MEQTQTHPPIAILSGDLQAFGVSRQEVFFGQLHFSFHLATKAHTSLFVTTIDLGPIPPMGHFIDIIAIIRTVCGRRRV